MCSAFAMFFPRSIYLSRVCRVSLITITVNGHNELLLIARTCSHPLPLLSPLMSPNCPCAKAPELQWKIGKPSTSVALSPSLRLSYRLRASGLALPEVTFIASFEVGCPSGLRVVLVFPSVFRTRALPSEAMLTCFAYAFAMLICFAFACSDIVPALCIIPFTALKCRNMLSTMRTCNGGQGGARVQSAPEEVVRKEA